MVEMTHSPSTSKLGTQFNDFLFAPIGENATDSASVASALARLDIDPWQEAAALNRLPRLAASRRLALLLDRLPETLSARSGSQLIADRLIAYLPKSATASSTQQASPVGQVLNSRVFTLACVVVSVALMIAVNSLIAHRSSPSSAAMSLPSAPLASHAP